MSKLILASSSPYRRQALARLGIEFDWIAPAIDESPIAGEIPINLAKRLALTKAKAIATTHPEAVIISGDQVLTVGAKIYGKPNSKQANIAMLVELAGKTGEFLTAISVVGKTHQSHCLVSTEVSWRNFTQAQAESYVEQESAIDCAGGAKIEGLGVCLVAKLAEAEPATLLGMPLVQTSRLLREFNLLAN